MSSQIIWPESQTIDGLELRLTCASHPEQYDVYEGDVQVAYFRLRGGRFRVDVPKCGGTTIYTAQPAGGDMFNDDERQKYLEEAVRAVRRSQGRLVPEAKPEVVWHLVSNPILPNESIPAERKVVLVWLEGVSLPFCGYIRYAAGCKDSPYFVVYHGNSDRGSEVIAWCDCLPNNGPDIESAKMYTEQQASGLGLPARIV